MTNDKLSKRLQLVGEFVPNDASLLDIGSDHAYLPIALTQMGKIKHAIAGEVVQGPYNSAKHNVLSFSLENEITVRLANGLQAFDPKSDDVDTITICGMGGHLIADILDADLEKLTDISTLILQPNNGERTLRQWLQDHQFKISHEKIMSENDKIYEIIVAQPCHASYQLSQDELVFGPILMTEKSTIFNHKWQSELKANQAILAKIPESSPDKRQEFEARIAKIKEVLHASK